MAKKLFIQLQKPFIEMEVKGESSSGEKATIFSRFSLFCT